MKGHILAEGQLVGKYKRLDNVHPNSFLLVSYLLQLHFHIIIKTVITGL